MASQLSRKVHADRIVVPLPRPRDDLATFVPDPDVAGVQTMQFAAASIAFRATCG